MSLNLYGSNVRERNIVPGDPAAVEADAVRLRELASTLDDLTDQVRDLDVGIWAGVAADRFEDFRTARRNEFIRYSDLANLAAHILTTYAETLRAAQTKAGEAIRTWQSAERLVTTNATEAWAMQDRAQVTAHQAQGAANTAGHTAADQLRELMSDLPYRPTFWNHVGHHTGELGAGARESFGVLFRQARAIVDPAERLRLHQEGAEAMKVAARDPVGFRDTMLDPEGLVDSPARWIGGFAPDLLGGAVSGGGAAAASRGLRAADRLSRTGEAVRKVDGPSTRAAPLATAGGQRNPLEMGEWKQVPESMSDRSRDYQEQITSVSSAYAYVVDDVKFDGVTPDYLLDAKGRGYAQFLRDGEFLPFYQGIDSLLEQADRQVRAASGVPIRWYVAEPDVAEYLTRRFKADGAPITIIHVAPVE